MAIGGASRAVGDSAVSWLQEYRQWVRSNAMGSSNPPMARAAMRWVPAIHLGDDDAAIGTSNNPGQCFFGLSGNNARWAWATPPPAGSHHSSAARSSAAAVAQATRPRGATAVPVVENILGHQQHRHRHSSVASAAHRTAIGSNSVADRVNPLSVGAVGLERQIVNVADASEDTDVVNLSQLYPLAPALGGGASYSGGIFTAPTYLIQSNDYNNVGSAFSAVDTALTDINQRIVNAGGIQGERGFSAYEVAVSNGFAGTEVDWLESLNGAQGRPAPLARRSRRGGPRSVSYDSDARDVLTMAGTDGTRTPTWRCGGAGDAVNLGQMRPTMQRR